MCVTGGRAFYSVARAGQLPSAAAKLNSKGMCACVYVCVCVCVRVCLCVCACVRVGLVLTDVCMILSVRCSVHRAADAGHVECGAHLAARIFIFVPPGLCR
jgi:hypothetical protein